MKSDVLLKASLVFLPLKWSLKKSAVVDSLPFEPALPRQHSPVLALKSCSNAIGCGVGHLCFLPLSVLCFLRCDARNCGTRWRRCQGVRLLLVLSPLTDRGEVKDGLGLSVRPLQEETLEAEFADVVDMGVYPAHEFNPPAVFWQVGVVRHEADRTVNRPGVGTHGNPLDEPAVEDVQYTPPVNRVIPHETVEHVLLTIEQTTQCRNAVVKGVLHLEKGKEHQQLENPGNGILAVRRFWLADGV